MRRLLRPDVAKLLLFAAFLLIAVKEWGHLKLQVKSDHARSVNL